MAAPVAWMEFDEHSEPLHGHMEGGVTMDSATIPRWRAQDAWDVADGGVEFCGEGRIEERAPGTRRGDDERGDERGERWAWNADGCARRWSEWRSPVVEGSAGRGSGQGLGQGAGQGMQRAGQTGEGQLEVETMRGSGGVTITSESQRGNAPATPSKMSADEVTGSFGAGSALRTLSGVGHAEIDETTATGTRQTANGDRLEASFAPPAAAQDRDQVTKGPRDQEGRDQETGNEGEPEEAWDPRSQNRDRGPRRCGAGATEVQSAELDGNVVLFEQPAAKPGAPPPPPLRATAGKAVYEGQGEWLHLTMSPRVENGGMELTAEKVDMSQQSGDAFAHGDVKATWTGAGVGGTKSRPASGE